MTEKRHSAAVQQGPGNEEEATPIGEFDGAARLPGDAAGLLATPLYWLYEMGHAALDPARAFADATRLFYRNPANPIAHTTFGKSMAASLEVFERVTRRYGRPEWQIESTVVGAERVPVHINTVWERPFCRLLHFERAFDRAPRRPQPKNSARGTDVGSLRDLVARYGRGLPAQP